MHGYKYKVFRSNDITKILRSCPSILRKGAEFQLPERLAALKSVLPNNNVVDLIRRWPAIMMRNSTWICEHVGDMKKTFGEEAFSKMVEKVPSFLSVEPKMVAEKRRRLEALLPGIDITALSVAYPLLYMKHFDCVVCPRIKTLKRYFSPNQIFTMITKCSSDRRRPHLMEVDLPSVLPKRIEALADLFPEGVDTIKTIVDQPLIITKDPSGNSCGTLLKRRDPSPNSLCGGFSIAC